MLLKKKNIIKKSFKEEIKVPEEVKVPSPKEEVKVSVPKDEIKVTDPKDARVATAIKGYGRCQRKNNPKKN
jgi:hypothetical protein